MKLSDICIIKYGKDHKHLSSGNIPVYGSGGLMRYVDSSLYDKKSVLIPRKGTLNNLFFVNQPFWTVDTLFYTQINENIVYPEYLYYFLKTANLADMNVGTSVPSLTTDVLNEIQISLPPLFEQRAIAHILRTLDDKIEMSRKMNETLEAMAQALFKSWFVDFEGVAPEDMYESEIGLIPKRWRVGRLRDVCTVIGGFAFKSKDFSTEGHPVVKIKNISNSLDVDLQDVDYVSIEIASKASKFYLEDGSLVMAMTGATVGKFGLVLNQSKLTPVLNQRVALLKPKEDGLGFLLSALLTTNIYDQVILRAQGSAQPNISADGIMDSELIIPTREIQMAFSQVTNPLFERWIVNRKESLVLETTRDTLLPKLISGQLCIKDAEKFLESHI